MMHSHQQRKVRPVNLHKYNTRMVDPWDIVTHPALKNNLTTYGYVLLALETSERGLTLEELADCMTEMGWVTRGCKHAAVTMAIRTGNCKAEGGHSLGVIKEWAAVVEGGRFGWEFYRIAVLDTSYRRWLSEPLDCQRAAAKNTAGLLRRSKKNT